MPFNPGKSGIHFKCSPIQNAQSIVYSNKPLIYIVKPLIYIVKPLACTVREDPDHRDNENGFSPFFQPLHKTALSISREKADPIYIE